MSRMFCTKIKPLARKTVLKFSLFQIFYKWRLQWSSEIHRFRKIVNFDTNLIISIFFKFLFISKEYGSSYFYNAGKNVLATYFFF